MQITPRNPRLGFDPELPRHWFGGNAVATQIVNSVNLLFPAGERFFVRSVRHFLDDISDEDLRRAIQGFAGQEGRHAQAHERFFDTLEAQGYRVHDFVARYERIAYEVIAPRLSPSLRLAITAALEHYTALMAAAVLRGGELDVAHPELRALLLWHAAEEIEHRAVAFDVLQRVDPRYSLRMAGMAFATIGLVAFWAAGLRMLLKKDASDGYDLRRHARRRPKGRHSLLRDIFIRGIAAYARPKFHPSDADIDHLAATYLQQAALS